MAGRKNPEGTYDPAGAIEAARLRSPRPGQEQGEPGSSNDKTGMAGHPDQCGPQGIAHENSLARQDGSIEGPPQISGGWRLILVETYPMDGGRGTHGLMRQLEEQHGGSGETCDGARAACPPESTATTAAPGEEQKPHRPGAGDGGRDQEANFHPHAGHLIGRAIAEDPDGLA